MWKKAMRMKLAVATASVALGLVLAASPAEGALITFEFSGVIDSVSDPANLLGGAVSVGSTFTGSYTFDSNTPDSDPADPELGAYQFAGQGMSLSAGAFQVAATPSASSRVYVGNQACCDSLFIGSYYFESAGLYINSAEVFLMDPTATAFDSDALVVAPPDLADFSTHTLAVHAYKDNPDIDVDIYGTVTVLTPEPGSLILMSIGMFLGRRPRNSSRRNTNK